MHNKLCKLNDIALLFKLKVYKKKKTSYINYIQNLYEFFKRFLISWPYNVNGCLKFFIFVQDDDYRKSYSACNW